MGNTGTDPGTSGDASSEEASIVVRLQLAPISDAPQGHDANLPLAHNTSFVLSPERFGFSDVDGDQFTGIRVTELPDSGQLLLNGVPVVADQEISEQDLANLLLVYIRLDDALAQHDLALRNAAVAAEALRLARLGFEAGRRPAIEVADTVAEAARAADEAAQRDARRWIEHAQLLAVAGVLPDQLGVPLPVP